MQSNIMPMLSIKALIIALICMLVHIFWCNIIPIGSYIFSTNEPLVITKSLLNTVIYVILGALILAILFSANLLLAKIVITLMNLIGAFYTYYMLHFGIQMSDELMMSMLFFAESNDIVSSFDWTIFIYVPLIFIPAHVLISYALKKLGLFTTFDFSLSSITKLLFKNTFAVAFNIIILLLFLGFIYIATDTTLLVYRLRTIAEQTMPSYFLARKTNIKKLASANLNKIKLKTYDEFAYTYNPKNTDEPLIVVLVIGEALRSNKLNINGYTKDTTPHMNKIPNLFSFKNVLSCSTTTAVSLPCMLTDELQDGWIKRFSSGSYVPKYSVAKIFTDTGFDTRWLSAANKDYGIYIHKDFHGSKSVMLSNELRRKFIAKENDFGDALLVKAMDVNTQKDTLYILGTMGSHREYFSRYPKHMAKFKPDMGNSIKNINNAYDNTVVYFDQFMFNLTNKLKDKNAFVIYASDHGESLGENGIFLHGAKVETAPDEQRLVPMIAWMSDKYIKNHPDKFNNIQRWKVLNNNQTVQIKHDFLFHSLLDCSGIKSPKRGIDRNLSICSKTDN